MRVCGLPQTWRLLQLVRNRQLNLGGLAVCAAILLCAGTARAGIISYLDQTDFNTATAGGSILTQNFDSVAADAGATAGSIVFMNNPLNSSTNAGMLAGLKIDASINNDDIAIVGAGFNGIVTNSVFALGGADLGLIFAGGVQAASVDALSLDSTSDIAVTAFDALGNLLGTFTAPGAGTSDSFIGFTTTGSDLIGLLVLAPGAQFAGTDQVQFGSIGTTTPEPSTLALLGTGIALFALRKLSRVV